MGVYRKRRKDGVLVWYADYLDPTGRRIREVAGRTKEQALDRLYQRKHEVRSGTWVHPRDQLKAQKAELEKKQRQEELRSKQRGPTFSDFADRFTREHGSKCKTDYYDQVLRPIKPFFQDKHLRDITPADLDAFRTERSEHAGPSTVRKNLMVLQKLFRMAVRWGVLQASPAVDLEKPPEPSHRTRYLTEKEWQKLEQTAADWLRPILTMAVATGMRLKEVLGLEWSHMEETTGLLHVPEDSKTGTRAIPMGETARAVLKARREAPVRSPVYVFLDAKGQPCTTQAARNRVSKETRATMKAAGIQGSFHILRHTAASWMVQAGVPILEVKEYLGHRCIETTLRYAHLQPGHLSGTVPALDAALSGGDTLWTPGGGSPEAQKTGTSPSP